MIRELVVLDSSAIIHSQRRKIDIASWMDRELEAPFQLCTTRAVIRELGTLSLAGSADLRLRAQLALRFLSGLPVIETTQQAADDSIVEIAIGSEWTTVFTDDALLKRRLLSMGVRVATITRNNRIVVARPRAHIALSGKLP
jgi:rRNA-processing protein FCF1